MYCGACGQENPSEHRFCSGCGKPLRATTPTAPSQSVKWSVILQAPTADETSRYYTIKKLAEVMKTNEQQAKQKVEAAPCILATVESLAEAERLRRELRPTDVALLIRPVGQEQLEHLREQARPQTQELPQRTALPHHVPTYEELAEMGRKVEEEYEARSTGRYWSKTGQKTTWTKTSMLGVSEAVALPLSYVFGLSAALLWQILPLQRQGGMTVSVHQEIAKWLLPVAFVVALTLVARRKLSVALGVVGKVVGVAIVFFFFTLIIRGCESVLTTSSRTPDRIEALTMAQQFVRDALPTPSTAKFPWPSEHDVEDLGQGRWKVISYVDAENVFGARVRTHYAVVIQHTGNGKWRLEDIATQ